MNRDERLKHREPLTILIWFSVVMPVSLYFDLKELFDNPERLKLYFILTQRRCHNCFILSNFGSGLHLFIFYNFYNHESVYSFLLHFK